MCSSDLALSFRACVAAVVIAATAPFAAAKPVEKVKSREIKSEKVKSEKIQAREVVPVPEPGVLTLLGVSLGAGVLASRLRKRAVK